MVENINHVDGVYALALQLGDYRAAAWQAIRALRRGTVERELWTMRLQQSLARRHEVPGPESTGRALPHLLGALWAWVRRA